MIEGVVNAGYEPVVPLRVQGPSGHTMDIEAVVDTGFTGFLTLPPALMTDLRLRYRGRGWATLADGSEAPFDVYGVTVLWDGLPRLIEADEADSIPLVGMRLLEGHNLNIEVRDGGSVVIQARE